MTDLEVAVQLLGGPTNKVIYDNLGLPSIMVRFDKGNNSDVITGSSEQTHAAFIINNTEIPAFWYSKYQNIIINGNAYSLPLQDPKTAINFDSARTACENKGAGWHLGTNAEWAWIALQCRKNGFKPRGNDLNGKDYSRTDEKGVVVHTYESSGATYNGRVATGSGPKSWAHNNDASGVWDFNGNVNEWIGGFRLKDGELNVLPNNDAADKDNPQNATSTLWRAIVSDGSLVTPATDGTLKLDYYTNPGTSEVSQVFCVKTALSYKQESEIPYGAMAFTLLSSQGVTVPEIMKTLALYPPNSGDIASEYFYMRNKGERMACRGGEYTGSSSNGVFSIDAKNTRLHSDNGIGFRAAFADFVTNQTL